MKPNQDMFGVFFFLVTFCSKLMLIFDPYHVKLIRNS